MKFMEREFPRMVPRYEKLYAKKYPPEAYRKEVQAIVRTLQDRYGLNPRKRDEDDKEEAALREPEQVGFVWR
jgi:hypothetical protein